MTDESDDIFGVTLHCRFGRPELLRDLIRDRLPHFTSFVEDVADKNGIEVLWTDQPGGVVTKRKFRLDRAECAVLSANLIDSPEFSFLAWTPWTREPFPSIGFARRQLMGDKTHINIEFPPYCSCHYLDFKREIDYLTGFEENKDLGFTAYVSLKTNNPDSISPYEQFNIYHFSAGQKFQQMGVERRNNSNLEEGVFVEPADLARQVLAGSD